MQRPTSQAHPDRRPPGSRRGARAIAAGAIVVLGLTAIAVGAITASPPPAALGDVRPSPIGSSLPSVAPLTAVASATPGTPAPAAGTVGSSTVSPPVIPAQGTDHQATSVMSGPFAGDLMIADRQNGRIIIVDPSGSIRWRFPVVGSLPKGVGFGADDAFLSPDGKTIVANEEGHEVIVRIDIATHRIVWQYGRYDVAGSRAGQLHTPDDAYPLANGDVLVADIGNCRIIEINQAKSITRQWGRTGQCVDGAPKTYGSPNGDTPLPDGGLLITEIKGSRVVRLDAAGHVVFDIHVPTAYPSDAHLDANGNILVVDYSNPGAIIRLDPKGHVLWRYAPRTGTGRLDHPSLAIDLTSGLVAVNDDFRHRVLVIDPTTNRIVWSYGHTDIHRRADGYLFTPDGIDEIPPAIAATL